MAKYTHLEIYKRSYDFFLYYGSLFLHFQREYRFTIGENLMNLILEFIVLIFKANDSKTSEKRAEYLSTMQDKIKHIDLLLRLSFALKNISQEKYILCTNFTQDIEKQLSGWLNYTNGVEAFRKEKEKGKQKGRTIAKKDVKDVKEIKEEQMHLDVPFEEPFDSEPIA